MPKILLPDGKKINFENKVNGFEIAKKISRTLEKKAIIMEVDSLLKDLSHEITKDSSVRIITENEKEGSWHTSNNRSSY